MSKSHFGFKYASAHPRPLKPQICKIRATKKVEDISTTFIVINMTGLLMYSTYAWYNNILHMAISTTLSACFSGYLLFLKCIYTLD